MKKTFESPKIEILIFENSDVVTASGDPDEVYTPWQNLNTY